MKLQRAVEVSRVLNQLYPNPPIPLNHKDAFTFLIAVVLSAQTTDGRVNDVTKVLFQKAPTPEMLSKLSVSEVLEIIAPVGLAARKAHYLVNLSQKILQDFDGKVPSNHEALETLPGVGNKTASVIMSQAFGEPSLAVDTHVHRLANRWGLSKESNVDKVQTDLCSLFPKSDWNNIHLQMIYFGREYCPAKDHQASECPICSWVNNPQRSPPTSFESFRRHSKNKGIIFYQDRISELADNPSLATLSLPSTSSMPETDSSAHLRSETIDSQTQPTTLRRGRSVSRKRIREENDSLS